jgi:hypothetical protein
VELATQEEASLESWAASVPIPKFAAFCGATFRTSDANVRIGPLASGQIGLKTKIKGLTMEPENPSKQIRAAEKLAAMILEDLRKVDGCPERGVNVTVYGIPWNAMLMFGAAAGPVRNKAELQGFFKIITERLQRLYDIAL